MIDGYGRGVIEGGTLAKIQPALTGNNQQLAALAQVVYIWLNRQGYAHLEPVERFIAGFTDGFKQARYSSASL